MMPFTGRRLIADILVNGLKIWSLILFSLREITFMKTYEYRRIPCCWQSHESYAIRVFKNPESIPTIEVVWGCLRRCQIDASTNTLIKRLHFLNGIFNPRNEYIPGRCNEHIIIYCIVFSPCQALRYVYVCNFHMNN